MRVQCTQVTYAFMLINQTRKIILRVREPTLSFTFFIRLRFQGLCCKSSITICMEGHLTFKKSVYLQGTGSLALLLEYDKSDLWTRFSRWTFWTRVSCWTRASCWTRDSCWLWWTSFFLFFLLPGLKYWDWNK